MDYNEIFAYCPLTGNLTWKPRIGERKRVAKFNTVSAGTVAGSKAYATNNKSKPRGIVVRVRGAVPQDQYAHRMIWEMTNGPIPSGMVIDHINGNPFDNRLENLRLATHGQNLQNMRLRSRSKAGLKGVRYEASRNLWTAEIRANGVRYRLGRFQTKGLAAVARAKAALRYHGEFARFA
jgi:hypothetical protein